MRGFRKTCLSVLCVLCMLGLVSAASLGLYYHSDLQYYMDAGQRASLAGTLDALIIGSSHGWYGISTQILDEESGVCSYNLSGGVMPVQAKLTLLEKELKRNPVKTVLIEITCDSMRRDSGADFAEGDEAFIARLDTWGERLDYLRGLSPNDWVNVYSRALLRGFQCWLQLLKGGGGKSLVKGYYPHEANDISIPAGQIAGACQSERYSLEGYLQENMDGYSDLIALCRQYGAEPVVLVAPVSDRMNWTMAGLQDFHDWLSAFCAERDCPFYDFNLLIDRYALLNDRQSFLDAGHLSQTGAEAFTGKLAAVLSKAAAGESTEGCFYADYDQMLADSPYARVDPEGTKGD